MARMKRRQKLLNIALGTLFAVGIEFAVIGFGRLLHHLSCLMVGIGAGLAVGWFSDARTGFFTGLLAWVAVSVGAVLHAQFQSELKASPESDDRQVGEPWRRVTS